MRTSTNFTLNKDKRDHPLIPDKDLDIIKRWREKGYGDGLSDHEILDFLTYKKPTYFYPISKKKQKIGEKIKKRLKLLYGDKE